MCHIRSSVRVSRNICQEDVATAPRGWLVIGAGGLAVGALTGLLGVGGRFLIVPALILLVGLPLKEAVGTSLAVIALDSMAALAGHVSPYSSNKKTGS